MKKSIIVTLILILNLLIPVYANEVPGYLADLSTQKGYEAYVAVVDQDKYPIGTTEGTNYTTHGMYIEYTDDNGKGLGEFRWTVDYTYNEEDKCMTFVGKPEELQTKQRGDLRLTIQTNFDPKDYPYVVICYRITDKAPISTNHIYVRDNRSHREYSAAERTWTPNGLVANGEWNYRILDMSKELSGLNGDCMGIRLPICVNEGDKFDVKYAAAFATKEAAESFDIETFEAYLANFTPEPTEEVEATPTDNTDTKGGSTLYTIIFIVAAVIVVAGVIAVYRFFSKRL